MKTLRLIGVTLLTVLLSINLTACSSSSDDSEIDMKAHSVEMNYYIFGITEEILDNIDIRVDYYNGGSEVIKEVLTKESLVFDPSSNYYHWEKTAKTTLPAKLGYRIMMRLKPEVGVDVGELEESGTSGYTHTITNAAGLTLYSEKLTTVFKLIDQSLLSKWVIDPTGAYSVSQIALFDSNGQVTIKGNWE